MTISPEWPGQGIGRAGGRPSRPSAVLQCRQPGARAPLGPIRQTRGNPH